MDVSDEIDFKSHPHRYKDMDVSNRIDSQSHPQATFAKDGTVHHHYGSSMQVSIMLFARTDGVANSLVVTTSKPPP